jgi:WD40 repeat protein
MTQRYLHIIYLTVEIVSWDQTSIQIWETTNGKLLGSLSDHVKKVTCVELDDVELVSGSTDKTIKKWDTETHKCKTTLQGHSATVNCLDITQNCIASGSNDRTVKLWDGRAKKAALSFSGHVCPVRCVKMNDYMVFLRESFAFSSLDSDREWCS